MQEKKVLFLVTSLNAGGIENYLLRYLNYNQEISPVILCKSGMAGDLEQEYVRRLGKSNIIQLSLGYLNVMSYCRLYKLCKQYKINVVCDFTGNFAGLPLMFASWAGLKKRISFYRGSTDHFKPTVLRKWYNSLMNKLTYKYATDILSNSVAAFDFFFPDVYKKDKRFKVIYNGIDGKLLPHRSKRELREQFGLPVDAFVVGHTGRNNYAKNHKTILEVAKKICSRYENVYFVMIGAGVEGLSSAIEANLSGRIKCMGYRNDILAILNLFDLYFFPSITEGQPNALIEAMVVGLPIIASNIAPIKETVPSCLHQFLREPKDVDGYVELIERCYFDKGFLELLKCKKWAVEHYDADKLFGKFEEVLMS